MYVTSCMIMYARSDELPEISVDSSVVERILEDGALSEADSETDIEGCCSNSAS